MLTVMVSLGSSGCFLDFDQFETRPGSITDAGDTSGDTGPGPDGASPDAGDAGDAGPTGPAIGSACSADADCAELGLCLDGYCTTECAEDMACPDGSSCRAWSGQMVCLADCDADRSCAGVGGRDDLECVSIFGQTDLGSRPAPQESCLTDADADSVADGVDNCPDTANPRQSDRDGDGQGDACDSEPLCHSAASNGLLDYGEVTYPATDFAVPETTTFNWLPVLGGVDDQGAPVADIAVLDRTEASWTAQTSLPYASFGRVVGAAVGGRYLVTPGSLQTDQPEFGEHVIVERDGSTSLGTEYNLGLHNKVIATTSLGVTLIFGYTDEAAAGTTSWRIVRYQPSSGTYTTVTSGSAYDRVDWHATTDLQGNVVFYSQVQPAAVVMRIVRIDPTGTSASLTALAPPQREPPATGQFDPFIVPGPGNVLYAFDRAIGSAARIDVGTGAVTRVNEYDLNLATTDARFVAVAGSPSFITVSRSEDDPTQIVAQEYFLPCLPGTDTRDEDGDGVVDISDNCPVTANPEQNDADFDSLGDACDPDADNDGVPNDSDKKLADDGVTEISLALDTDNDGVDNVDDDDSDQDGIPDSADRLPLDTDNDGLANHLDDDDDDDGYSDATEVSSSTDPLDPLSFPGIGVVAWVRDTGAARSLEYAPVDDPQSTTALSVADSTEPYQPRFEEAGASIFALTGEPGTATAVQLISTDPNAATPAQSFDMGLALRGAVPAEGGLTSGVLTSIIAVHASQQSPGTWQLSSIATDTTDITPLVTVFGQMDSPSVAPSRVAFLAAPSGCDDCLAPYVVPSAGGVPQIATREVTAPSNLRYDGQTMTMVAQASDGVGTAAYVYARGRLNELRPPGVDEIDSAVRMDDGHLLVSGRSDAQASFDLWLYNARNGHWYRVTSDDDDLVDIDWVPAVPAPPQPQP